MVVYVVNKIKQFFSQGHERSVLVKKHIVFSFFFKGMGIVLGFVMVPMIIDYVSPAQYGIWLTLSSIVTWFSFFDIGLGNGLRNKLTTALSNKDQNLARAYISTTYAILGLIALTLFVLFQVVNKWLNWSTLLNAPSSIKSELGLLASLIFSIFCLHLVFQLINVILYAILEPAKVSMLNLISSIVSFCSVLLLKYTDTVSIIYLGIAISLPPVLINILFTGYLFLVKYKALRPTISTVNFRYSGDLMKLGSRFFLIQIAAIILYQTNNIYIAHLCSSEDVTYFNVAYKYFNIITFVSGIILAPLWSAFNQAYAMNELEWINRTFKKMKLLCIHLTILVALLTAISGPVFGIWVNKLLIPFSITFSVAVFTVINIWNNLYSQFLNGTGKVVLQLYVGLACALLNIPLAYFLGIHYGAAGIIISSAIVSFIGLFIYPIQFRRIMFGKSNGIWNR